ncbi:transposase [Thermococcus sp. M39]|uniref:transposase n=1 Tax=unclassified Thermococcus TaxID=2627626 RepID=UPI00143ACA88|nr:MULTISPECIES: transposase [unclassified Thermococcus]NJE09003.1 transposase [Thermococcus sp. M39]NJE13332.1 transposase [Thermococcus sp. LS2]
MVAGARKIRRAEVNYITIKTRLEPETTEDYLKLALLCEKFKRGVELSTRLQLKGVKKSKGVKEISRLILNNWWYSDSAWDYAKMLVNGVKHNGGNPKHIHLKSKFLISKPKENEDGNRNVKIEGSKVRIRSNGEWLNFKLRTSKRFLPVILDAQKLKFGAQVILRNGKVYLHIQVPFEVFLRHFGRTTKGKLYAGFDLNSDRVNMVILDGNGIIRDVKIGHFPGANSPGFPKKNARDLRLKTLARLLDYARHHGVGVVFFEDLERIKQRNGKTSKSKKGNRKASNFAKKELLGHGVIMALKRGFEVFLVNPSGSSKLGKELSVGLGLDVHSTSAFVIGWWGLNILKIHESSQNKEQFR